MMNNILKREIQKSRLKIILVLVVGLVIYSVITKASGQPELLPKLWMIDFLNSNNFFLIGVVTNLLISFFKFKREILEKSRINSNQTWITTYFLWSLLSTILTVVFFSLVSQIYYFTQSGVINIELFFFMIIWMIQYILISEVIIILVSLCLRKIGPLIIGSIYYVIIGISSATLAGNKIFQEIFKIDFFLKEQVVGLISTSLIAWGIIILGVYWINNSLMKQELR